MLAGSSTGMSTRTEPSEGAMVPGSAARPGLNTALESVETDRGLFDNRE